MYKLLSEDEEVSSIVTKIFPVVAVKAVCPYIAFRAISSEQEKIKRPSRAADTLQMEILCCAKEYGESVSLAEAVRHVLDNRSGAAEGLKMRSCVFTDRAEDCTEDAFVQLLTFEIKV